MKTIYTILFFSDMVVLILLAYIFFSWLDAGTGLVKLSMLLLGIISSILFLVYCLYHYTKLPPGNNS